MPEIFIYDMIGPAEYGMIDAKTIVDQYAAIGNQPVTLRINSPGGAMDDAFAIYNAIHRHGNTTIEIDGIAASSASFVAMAGKQINMAENAVMMIHEPHTLAWGSAEEMRKMAGVLDNYRERLIATYAARTGAKASAAEIGEWIKNETWMTAKEAASRGFVDSIGQPLAVADSSKIAATLYRNTPANRKRDDREPDPSASRMALRRRQLQMSRAKTS